VDYYVSGGTALSGEDFSLDNNTLVFDPGELAKDIIVELVDDDFTEDPEETVEITIGNPVNARLGEMSEHTMTIKDPEPQLCPLGDLTGDCLVSVVDLQLFAEQWLESFGLCGGHSCCDLDRSDGVQLEDYAILAGNWQQSYFPVVINEVMASNSNTLFDPEEPDESPDWIELYNASVLTVELGGMYLTDDASIPTKWQIPAGVTIGPFDYLLFYADDDDEQGDMHTNYKLSASGEEVALYDSDGLTLLSYLEFGKQVTDISYGAYPDASADLRFFATPTPLAKNDGMYIDAVEDTRFSHDRGFYDAGFNLAITCDTPGATIKYTIDSTEPSQTNGTVYTGPLYVNSNNCVRAMAYKTGWLSTNVDTHTYILRATQQKKALPALSIVNNGVPSGEFDGVRTSVEVLYADHKSASNGF